MKACVLVNKNKMEYSDITTPLITNKDDVLVKIHTCGICSSDFNRIYGDSAYFFPLVLGHEFSGEIVECANNLDKSIIGKKVVVFPLLPCFKCKSCEEKHYVLCENYSYLGSRQNGAMAEYIKVPYWNIKILPDDMNLLIASLSEPMAVAINAINKIANITNKNICISGTGTIAVLCGLYARSKGAQISFIYRNNSKYNFLRNIGFTDFIKDSTDENSEIDILLECVGTNQSLKNCLKHVKSNGQIILVGNPASDITLDKKLYWKILRSELTINGVWNSNYKNEDIDDWDLAIDFLYKNQDTVSNVITDKFKLCQHLQAFEQMKQNSKVHLKGVFCNEQ